MADVIVSVAAAEDWDDLVVLWAADEMESVQTTPDAVREGAEQSLRTYDFLSSDSFWVLLARLGGQAAGFVHACRIPKADARAGFLYVDEVFVHPAHRRAGVGLAMLQRAERLSEELGLAEMRLLVRPENDAARALYRKAGYEEHPSILCQRQSSRRRDHNPLPRRKERKGS